jgi:fumarate hydratase class II
MEKRVERDSLGEVWVPTDSYWGATTQRSIENFQISGIRFPRSFIKALGVVKVACAKANLNLGILKPQLANAIIEAGMEVLDGTFDKQFPLDIFQTGSGTHTNMNANEVIANRASEILGKKRGSGFVHANDHVNLSQSSNDVIPTALHISALELIEQRFLPALEGLTNALKSKSEEFRDIVKTGRTHLMDATPITLGGEFATYAVQIEKSIDRVKGVSPRLMELPIGGTAVGTGVNAPREFSSPAVNNISQITGIAFKENQNRAEGIAAHDAIVETSGALKTIAVSMTKIANDVRWLSSGPGAGLGEISIPENEPGSSIMPGKINPTQAEALLMVCAQVIGNDLTITLAGANGNFELNTMKPIIAYNLLQSIEILTNSVDSFTKKCVSGIQANKAQIKKYLDKNLMMVTVLAPKIGYDKATDVAKSALKTGKTIRETALEMNLLSEKELDKLLDPRSIVG